MMHFSQRKYTHLFPLLCLLFAFGFFMQPRAAAAALTCPDKSYTQEQLQKVIQVSVPIPGVTFQCFDSATPTEAHHYIEDMGAYLGGIYKFFSGTIGIIAAGMIFYAGIRWMTAGGNRAHVQSAKETIVTSLVAVALVLGSYLILFTINPKLVNLNPPSIRSIVGLEQQFSYCPTTRTCQQGPKEGKSCKQDSDCGAGLSAGVCAWDVDVNSSTLFDYNLEGPLCGGEYTYLKEGVGNEGKCIGLLCETGKSCSANNPLDPVGVGSACISSAERCQAVTDNLPGVNFGSHDSLCRPLSVPGKGKCGWYDEYWFQMFNDDRCVWRPALVCPSGSTRVACDDCVNAGKSCGRIDLKSGSYLFDVDIPDWLPAWLKSPLAEYKNGKCETASTEVPVYQLDLTSDKQNIQSICCRKTDASGTPVAGTGNDVLRCFSDSQEGETW